MSLLLRRILRWSGIGLVVTLVLSWVLGRRRAKHARRRFEADAADPFRRWVQAVFGIVSGEADHADLGPSPARAILARWWHVHGPRELDAVLEELADRSVPDHAWNLVRHIVVTRLGVGAGWLDRDDAWDAVRPTVRRLQRAYDGWPALAHAYVVARRTAQGLAADGSEDDDGMRAILTHISRLRDGPWSRVAFHHRFETQEPPA
jgi:hypothetical protein